MQVYHFCEAEFHCFKGYSRLHYSDYYVTDLSIVATVWAMTRIKPPKKHLVFLALAILLQFAVTETFSSSYHFYINLILAGPALVYLICFQYVSSYHHQVNPLVTKIFFFFQLFSYCFSFLCKNIFLFLPSYI